MSTLLTLAAVAMMMTVADTGSLAIDCSRMLNSPMVVTKLTDQGVEIEPAREGRFVLLPLAAESLFAIEKSFSYRGGTVTVESHPKAKARLLGFRIMTKSRSSLQFMDNANSPIYERIDLLLNLKGELVATLVNTKLPGTKAAKAEPKKDLPRDATVLMIVEVAKESTGLTVGLVKGGSDFIDLTYLATAHEKLTLSRDVTVDHPAVRATLEMCGDRSGVMAALALARVGLWRHEAGDRSVAELRERLLQKLIAGLNHSDPRAVHAAWYAISRGALLSDAQVDYFRLLPANAIENIATEAARALKTSTGTHRRNVLRLIQVAWSKASGSTLQSLLNTVIADGRTDAYFALDGASDAGVQAMFEHLRTMTDRTARGNVTRSLIGQTPLEQMPALLAAAKAIELEVTDNNDPIFKRFHDTDRPDTRESILRAMQIVPATLIHRTRGFDKFVSVATDRSANATVREAGWRMVLAQAAMAPPLMSEQPFGAPAIPSDKGLDALTDGLESALRDGPLDIQVAALAAMIRRGEAHRAAEVVTRTRSTVDATERLLTALEGQPGIARLDGTFTFLIAAACKADPKSASTYLARVNRMAENYPAALNYRLTVNLKSGADYKRLIALLVGRETAAATEARQLMSRVIGSRSQRAEGLPKASTPRDAPDAYGALNQKIAGDMSGQYASLIVVETISPIDPARIGEQPTTCFAQPVRFVYPGPVVQIRSASTGCSMVALGKLIGGGKPSAVDAMLPNERLFPPTLKETTWSIFGVECDRAGAPQKFEPLALIGGTVRPDGAPGAMNVDAIPLVRHALETATNATNVTGTSASALLDTLPGELKLTLHPVGFGTLAGVGPSAPPSESATAAKPLLLNVLLILEPLD